VTIVPACLALEHLLFLAHRLFGPTLLPSHVIDLYYGTCTLFSRVAQLDVDWLADFAERLFVLIHAAFIAQRKVLRKLKVVLAGLNYGVQQMVGSWLHVQDRVKEAASAAFVTLKALWAFPLALWDQLELRCPTERVEGFVAHITIEQIGFLSSWGANVTELAVEALPIRLEFSN